MRKKLILWLVPLLLGILVSAGICWYNLDQLLDRVVRPQLETVAGRLLDAEVHIGSLTWAAPGLEIADLQLSSSQLQVRLPHTRLRFSLASLWTRQLEELHISAPELIITSGQHQQQTVPGTLQLPAQLPLAIRQISLSDGQISIVTPERNFSIHQLAVHGNLDRLSAFSLFAMIGPDQHHPFSLDGTLQLSPPQQLTLHHLSWQEQELLAAPLVLQLDNGKLGIGSSLVVVHALDQHRVQNLLQALGQASPLPPQLQFQIPAAELGVAFRNNQFGVTLQIPAAHISWDQLHTTWTDIRLALQQQQPGWQLRGQLTGPAQTALTITATVDASHKITGQSRVTIPALDPLLKEVTGAEAIPLQGGLQLENLFTLTDTRQEVSSRISGLAATASAPAYLVDLQQLNGSTHVLRDKEQTQISLQLQQKDHPLCQVRSDLHSLRASCSVADLAQLRQLLNPAYIPAQLQGVTQAQVTATAHNKDSLWTAEVEGKVAEAAGAGLQLHNILSKIVIQGNASRVQAERISLSAAVNAADTLAFEFAFQGDAEVSSRGLQLGIKQLSAQKLNFNSADGLAGVGNGTLELHGLLAGAWPLQQLQLDLNGTLSAAEVLAGPFYADLSSQRATISLTGQLDTAKQNLSATHLRMELADIATLTATGVFNPERLTATSRLALPDLHTGFNMRLKPLLQESFPQVQGIDLSGGLLVHSDVSWTPAGWLLAGGVNLSGLAARWDEQPLQISGVSGTLPFAISQGADAAGQEEDAERTGGLRLAALKVGPATLEDQQLRLTASPNRFRILSPLNFALAKGDVRIREVKLSWPNQQLQGSVGINVAGVDLEALTRDLELPVMQGNLSADLGTISYREGQLSTDGIASIEVFGGLFQFSQMRYSDPFSGHPTFSTDISFSDLDLLQATHTFDFGEMNGVLDGEIRNLELFGSVPSAFRATLATRSTGTRNISVKALNNLSILSQGGISSALSRGIYRFIDFYRYSKIAFDCALHNDTFTLTGTAKPGSNRYLVDGGLLPPKIDITTTTPTISFKEMVKRLGRIDRAGH